MEERIDAMLPGPSSDAAAMRWLGMLAIGCLLLFWATIPLPRADGQLVGSDGIGYYAYLPSLILDGDLDFSDEYAVLRAYLAQRGEDPIGPFTATGLPANQFTVGTALLWSPFFLLAHGASLILYALGLPMSIDGLSYLYQAVVLSGSILYGGGALLLAYRALRAWSSFGICVSFWACALVLLAGNLVYYMTAEPSMSHTTSAFLGAALFLAWQRLGVFAGWWKGAVYGALGGLLALVRPQMGLLLALPYLLALAPAIRSPYIDKRPLWPEYLASAALAAAVAGLVFAPQLLIWQRVFGSPLGTSYLAGDAPFHWLRPRLLATLMSSERGLLVWQPVFAVALAGLILGALVRHRACAFGLLAVLIQWYVVSSWSDWSQGDAFGGRMFIGCTAFWALGLAHVLRRLERSVDRRLLVVGAALLVLANALLLVAYRFHLYAVESPTWWDITIGRVVVPLRLMCAFLAR